MTTTITTGGINCITQKQALVNQGAPGTDAPFSVQFLLLSCNFRQRSYQIIGFCPKLRDWRPLPIWEIFIPSLTRQLISGQPCDLFYT